MDLLKKNAHPCHGYAPIYSIGKKKNKNKKTSPFDYNSLMTIKSYNLNFIDFIYTTPPPAKTYHISDVGNCFIKFICN